MVQLAIMIVSFLVVVWFIGMLIVGVDSIYLAPGRERKAAKRKTLKEWWSGKSENGKVLFICFVMGCGFFIILGLIARISA